MKHSLSPERPQLVECFTQQLMECAEQTEEGQVRNPTQNGWTGKTIALKQWVAVCSFFSVIKKWQSQVHRFQAPRT